MPTNPRRPSGWQTRFAKTTPAELADPLLKTWLDWMRAARLSELTIYKRIRTVDRFARNSGVSCVSACHEDLVAWFAGQHWKPATAASYFDVLNSWFSWLQRQEYRADNPMLRLAKPTTPPREPRPCSDSDLVRLLAMPRLHHKTRVMILFAALAGMRVSEVSQVKGEDIDAGRGLIWVLGKGGVLKSIPLHTALLSAAQTMPAVGWWFPGEQPGKHMQPDSVTATIGRAMRRARVGGTPHSLRHWYGSSLLQNGADLRTVQELLRHASLATTQIYTRVPDDRRHEAIATLDPWAGARAELMNRR